MLLFKGFAIGVLGTPLILRICQLGTQEAGGSVVGACVVVGRVCKRRRQVVDGDGVNRL